MPSILCYMPPPVERLGRTTPIFQTRTQDPQFSNQIDASEFTHAARVPYLFNLGPLSWAPGDCLASACLKTALHVTDQQLTFDIAPIHPPFPHTLLLPVFSKVLLLSTSYSSRLLLL